MNCNKIMSMKRNVFILLAAAVLAACTSGEEQLRQRAAELCQYVPDHELKTEARDYMTEDFYAVLDTLFNRLPAHEAMDHEWLYYFVTGNGGTMADYTVVDVERTDRTHAVATLSVRQQWEDGSFDETSDIEEHKLYMEKVGGKWLMADFDGHKADCIHHIALSHREELLREAVSNFLVESIGSQYAPGDVCIPVLMIAAEEAGAEGSTKVWGDFWVFNYRIAGDTLKTVSGGSHAGLLEVIGKGDSLWVAAHEFAVDGAGHAASAQRIFGPHYDIYQSLSSNEVVREAVRKEQLQEYVRRHHLAVKYYQDYGWEPVEL